MWIRAGLLAIVLALLTFHAPAQACMYAYPIDLADVRKADAVVIGRISNYTAILDPVIRQTLSEDFPDLSPERLEILRTRPNFVSDYFRFDLQVDEALRGKVDPKISITLYGSWIGPPESMPPGPFLTALERPNSGNPEPGAFRVMQESCSEPFLFPSTSDEARKVREILHR